MKEKKINWIAQSGTNKEHNLRGQVVGYWLDTAGRRRYVAYTMSQSLAPTTKSAAINLLANMAADTWTGARCLQKLI